MKKEKDTGRENQKERAGETWTMTEEREKEFT